MSEVGVGGAGREPIAVVSMSCRFGGGVDTVEQMWEFMAAGRDAVTAMPTDRGWDLELLRGSGSRRATSSTGFGAFLHDAAGFDADFFEITPREAVAMEPQQRLLLETSWEAIERAGIDPRSLRGSRTGVYFGVMQQEYGPRMAEMTMCRGYQDTGFAASMASGRVSYFLGLQGPSISLDTACSSSLVAIHTAMKALQAGECTLALAGGGTIVAAPSIFVGFSLMRVLSADGTTRPFSSDAAGFGVGEGVGVLVLERLSDALRAGHPVLAVLRGSAIASDGRSDALTVPNPAAQESAIRLALRDAGLDPTQVDVVETHGSSTQVGDPAEIAALTATYGAARTPQRPLLIGSSKSNFGHTQAGSGVAGMIKMVESIRRGVLPPLAHFTAPGSHIDWSSATVRVVDRLMPWPDSVPGVPRRGGVSGNGLSGVNCHIIVEQATPTAPRIDDSADCEPTAPALTPLVLSARTSTALAAQAARLHTHMRRHPDLRPVDLAHSLLCGRTPFEHRAAVVGADRAELLAGLAGLAEGSTAPAPTRGEAAVVFVFSGQGQQWDRMATELLDTSTVFTDSVARCTEALSEFVPWSVLDVLRGIEGAPPIDRVDVIQPVLFTVMVSLARVWQALGVHPGAVIGHSQGEIAAAHIAGALSLRDAAQTIARRSIIMATVTGNGAMVSIPLPAQQARRLSGADRLWVACDNGPRSCVLSGDLAAIDELLAHCAAQGISARAIPASVASHSPLVESLQMPIEHALDHLTPQTSRTTFFSTVTGERLDSRALDGHYWYRNTREPVRFDAAVRSAHAGGARVFVEVSAHPVLVTNIHAIVEDIAAPAEPTGADTLTVVGTLRRDDGGMRRFLTAAAELYSAGVQVDWHQHLADAGGSRVDLPTYPFQRRRFWMMPDEGLTVTPTRSRGTATAEPTPSHQTAPLSPARAPIAAPAPESTLAMVRRAVAAVSGHPDARDIDPSKTFAALGLDSLATLELRNRLGLATGIELRISDLVAHPSPADLSALLLARIPQDPCAQPGDTSPGPHPPVRIGSTWPLTPYQAELVALGLRYPDRPVVQAAHCIRLIDATDVSRLTAAVRRLRRRHEALRLSFLTDETPPRQQLHAPADDVEFVDFLPEPDPATARETWVARRIESVLPAEAVMSEFVIVRDEPQSLILFTRFHHAIADGWSLILMAREITADYFADATVNTAVPSYLDIVHTYHRYRESGQWVADKAALVERFRTLSPALFERDPAASSAPPLHRRLHVERAAVDRLRAAGPISTLIVAAVGVHLFRVHATGDVILGVTLLNRETVTELSIVGDLTNVLPVHVPVTEARSMAELADAVEHQVRDLQERQRFPFGELLAGLREADASTSALFDVRLTYNKIPAMDHTDRIRRDISTLSPGYTLDAVNIIVNEYAHDGTIDVEIFCAPDVFGSHDAVEIAVRQVLEILDRSAGAVHATPAAVSPVHIPQRVGQFEGPAIVPFDQQATIPTILSTTTTTSRRHHALVWTGETAGTRTLTYGEFADRVQVLAAALRERGVQPQEFVAVALPRSVELVVAVHAVMAVGAAFVPISPDHPPHRVRAILADCQARYMICETDSTTAVFDDSDENTPDLECISPTDTATDHRADPGPGVAATDLAYLIYTSGSTGVPKGVMIEHRSLANRLHWMQRRYPLTPGDVILHKTPHTFDVSVWELTWWALAGATAAILPEGAHGDPRKIVAAIAAHRVTVVHFVPSMFGPFLDELAEMADVRAQLHSLRFVFCSGEALAPAVVRRFGRLFTAAGLDTVVLVNLYGPTEAAIDVSFFEISPAAATSVQVVPIGRPIDNMALLVLDRLGGRCAIGSAGELNIAGVGVARGYHNRPESTAHSFLADPSVPGGRRYRTGDRARWLPDGNLEYLGRLDDEVKIRGYRVTPAEITVHLLDCPAVHAAVVLAENDENGSPVLIAYYTGPATPAQASGFLRNRLPAPAIPSHFLAVDAIPLTHNGKADHARLRSLRTSSPQRTTPTRPTSDIERRLLHAWTDVLGGPEPELTDDFFTVGGDSIRALSLRSAARQRGVELELDTIFTHPTLEALARAAALTTESGTDPAPTSALAVTQPFELVSPLDRAALPDLDDAFPASALQLGMVYHASQHATSAQYKDVFHYRFTMEWNSERFTAAFDKLVHRHPALRSSFDIGESTAVLQLVHRHTSGALDIAEPDDQHDIDNYRHRMRTFPYTMNTAPLYRMRVYPAPQDRVDIVFSFHHAILDGWSVTTLIEELLQDYLNTLSPGTAPVGAQQYSTLALAEHVRAEQSSVHSAASKQFWTDELTGASCTTIESARHYEAPDPEDDGRTLATIPRWLQYACERLGAMHRVSMKSLLLVAHLFALLTLSGSDDVTTGLVSHTRTGHPDAESVAGLFLNTVPIRLGSAHRSWLDAVTDIAARERAGRAHRRYPLQSILADHGGPVFDTAFNYVHYHRIRGLLTAGALTLEDFRAYEETNFALMSTASLHPADHTLQLFVGTTSDGLTRAQREDYVRWFLTVLSRIAGQPEAPIHLDCAADVCSILELNAAIHPARIALLDDTSTWTYGRLLSTAASAATELTGLGVRPGDRVALRMHRSPARIAILIAILRAGAAVVPIDPDSPPSRIDAMLAISRPAAVIGETEARRLLEDTGRPAVPPAPIQPDDIAYVLFTSGSTGEPKGVAMPHRSLTNLVRAQNDSPTAATGGLTAQFAPLIFDVAFQEIFSTLCGGGTLRLLSDNQRTDPLQLCRALSEPPVQRVFLPYVALQTLAETAHAKGCYPRALTAIVSSGEQLRITDEIRALCAANPGVVLENQYGPTETHVALRKPLLGNPAHHPALPAVGTALAGLQTQLLDAALQPVKPGAVGEIYITGAGVARGYENRAGLTAQRFVAGPDGIVRYRTGDLGTHMTTGEIRLLGRSDAQVKVRGFRVETAEVELALHRLTDSADIAAIAVLARTSPHTAETLLDAFLVTDRTDIDTTGLRRRLRSMLPAHMIPSRMHLIDTLPLTPTGKRDDSALRALATQELRAPDLTAAPADDTLEHAVAAVLAGFADGGDVGLDTNFFDAGGTSIGALRALMTIERRWGTELGLEAFLAAPTPRELAIQLRGNVTGPATDPVVLLRAGEGTPLFLVHPIGGTVLCYRDLAAHLPTDRPVYGLQAPGTSSGTQPFDTVEALAATYIDAIHHVRPTGPYHIAGWSFGGYVAYEMARRLPTDDLLGVVLLDTVVVDGRHTVTIPPADMVTWFFTQLLWDTDATASDLHYPSPSTDSTDTDGLFDQFLQHAGEAQLLPPNSSPTLVRRLFDIFCANVTAALDYRVEPIDRDVVLLRATEAVPTNLAAMHRLIGSRFEDATNGWNHHGANRFQRLDVPGNHLTMVREPNVARVAQHLGWTLESAEHRHHLHDRTQQSGPTAALRGESEPASR